MGYAKVFDKQVTVKYGSNENFLVSISKKLEIQKDFKQDSKNENHIELKSLLNNDIDTKISEKSFNNLLKLWLDAYISPEVITQRVNKYLKENKYKDYNNIFKNEDYSRLSSIKTTYYNEIAELDKLLKSETMRIIQDEIEQKSKIQTTGLGFGIATSSIGNAMLYSAMNENERRRQYNRQAIPIMANSSGLLALLPSRYTERADIIYQKFKNKVIEYVTDVIQQNTSKKNTNTKKRKCWVKEE